MAPSNKSSKLHNLACSIQKKLHLGGRHSVESSKRSSTTSTTEGASTSATTTSEAVVAAAAPDDGTSLEGKVAIVTGSSRSIGAAVAKSLAEKGAKVVVNYVNDSKAADEVVDEIKAFNNGGDAVAVKADASTIEGGQHLLNEAVKTFGKLDILVLNAGIMGSKTVADVDEDFFDAHFNTNVKVPLFLTKAAVPLMPVPGGRIIFFSSSLTGATGVLPNALTYVASKGAVEQICRALAKDLGAQGFTVNTISPGPVDTTLFRAGKPEHVIKMIAGQNPNNRLGQPEDIAPMVAFVASPAAQWVNGQNIRVNGGFVV